MTPHRNLIFILPFLLCSFLAQAQQEVMISGKVFQENGEPVHGLMVVNKRTYLGQFGGSNGQFSIKALHTDTITLGAFGLKSVNICFADSTYQESYTVELILPSLIIEVGTAEVFAPRELQSIYKDIERLGFNEKDYMVSGVDALSSPITFLYERFSRREQSKRLVFEMENDDRRRELLKELFKKYVDFEIIDLSDDQFDAFIDFLNVSDEFLKATTQHEFLLYVKDRYKVFRRDIRRLKDSDFDYHLDQE